MEAINKQIGVVDSRFLSRSVGLLNPPLPLTVQDTSTVGEALEILRTHKLGCIVVQNDAEKIIGIFTERDVVLKLSWSKDALLLPVTQLMTKNPHTIEMTTPVAYALQMMSQGGYRHLPIVDKTGVAVGILTVKELVDFIAGSIAHDLQSFSMPQGN